MQNQLYRLQQAFYQYETRDGQPYFYKEAAKLYFSPVGRGLYDIVFYGNGYDDESTVSASELDPDSNLPFCLLLDLLAQPHYAERVYALTFTGSDVGANGTKSWDFNRIAHSATQFPNLKHFHVQLTQPDDHNHCILDTAFSYEENGMTAKLLAKMPVLETLYSPSAPSIEFCQAGSQTLKELIIQAGYDTQNFIRHLTENRQQFPSLSLLDYNDGYGLSEHEYTPFADYAALMDSPLFTQLGVFVLRNPQLSHNQIAQLKAKEGNGVLWIK